MENDRLPKIVMDCDRKLALEGRGGFNFTYLLTLITGLEIQNYHG